MCTFLYQCIICVPSKLITLVLVVLNEYLLWIIKWYKQCLISLGSTYPLDVMSVTMIITSFTTVLLNFLFTTIAPLPYSWSRIFVKTWTSGWMMTKKTLLQCTVKLERYSISYLPGIPIYCIIYVWLMSVKIVQLWGSDWSTWIYLTDM